MRLITEEVLEKESSKESSSLSDEDANQHLFLICDSQLKYYSQQLVELQQQINQVKVAVEHFGKLCTHLKEKINATPTS